MAEKDNLTKGRNILVFQIQPKLGASPIRCFFAELKINRTGNNYLRVQSTIVFPRREVCHVPTCHVDALS